MQLLEVLLEPSICFGDQPLVKSGFTCPRLVAGAEDDPVPLGIERKSHAPNTAIGPKPKLSHIGERRTVQRIHLWPAERRSALAQCHEHGQQGILDLGRQIIEFLLAGGMKGDGPRHQPIMRLSALCGQAHGGSGADGNAIPDGLGY